MTEPWESEVILRDSNNDPIPQRWDAVNEKFVPDTGTIPQFAWNSGDAAPTLSATSRAFGVVYDAGDITLKWWNGTGWEDVD